ncbi:hypothetical protein LMG28727_06592 [Paraburkholderia kirstenboschensis]|uniref:hypothetical protein n=1 Tax=Paraburkholderia kirstenboschensis TaxID=1245436 RepID=UPI000A552D16|nr:hypothetical protein [Paraburkholderia kirstenboschensis]CAD6558300.1 hypothetical protein LMG28727_06592 [Paraburkholderia kirstenboschensis]
MQKAEVIGLGIVSAAAALAATVALTRTGTTPGNAGRQNVARTTIPAHLDAARKLNRSSALLALSVLADSGMEHYRGSFENRVMYTPLVVSVLSLGAGVHGGMDRNAAAHRLRDAIYLTAAATGVIGNGFHLYNIVKRPGGFGWSNLFYAAPIGAPIAMLLSGALGAVAERLRDEPARDPRLAGMPAGRALALLASVGLIGTVGEAALLHFRGAFHNPAMYAPVAIPPLAVALLAHAAIAEPQPKRWITRMWLRCTALLGFAGVGFHTFGVARNMGGWRNWSQNIFSGPPLPAPPSFTALALAGLAALGLREGEADE